MVEIRVHGRGGQGAVVAADLLALAFAKEGKCVQSFPSFGPERRSAPLAAFVRVDETPIRLRCEIYHPDYLLVLDPSLFKAYDITSGLKEGGGVIINSRQTPGSFEFANKFRVTTVDASSIAVEHKLGGRTNPIVNTAMLGAFAKATNLVGIDAIVDSIRESIPANREGNIEAARESYNRT